MKSITLLTLASAIVVAVLTTVTWLALLQMGQRNFVVPYEPIRCGPDGVLVQNQNACIDRNPVTITEGETP